MVPRGHQVHGDEPVERADPHQEGGRATGGPDVSQGVSGERLPSDDGEGADDAGDVGDDAAHDQCHVDRRTREEPGFEHGSQRSGHPHC